MNIPDPAVEFFWSSPIAFVLYAIIAVVVLVAVAFLRRPTTKVKQALMEVAQERIFESGSTRCPCGDVATEPPPGVKRSRGALNWMRNYFGMPPRWKREVDHFRPHVYCASHAHVADEMVNHGLMELRAKYAAMNVEASIFLAGLEQEHLYARVSASITDKQKKDQARAKAAATPSPLRSVSSIVRTGTDDDSPSV